MKSTAFLLLVALVAATGCNQSDNSQQTSNRSMTNDGAFGNYIYNLGQAKQTAAKTVDVASLGEEIHLFQVDKGHFPSSLDELVQEHYIKRVPDAPAGMKIDYNSESGDVKVVNQ